MYKTKQQWLEHAITAGLRGNLMPKAVTEAYHIIYSAVGDDWLKDQDQKANANAYGFMAGHPLMRSLRMGRPNATSEVVELAQYLKEFSGRPETHQILARLKDPDLFEDCVFELAVAARFQRLNGHVVLSPPTDRGTADFELQVAGNTWVCECTRQHQSDEVTKRASMRNSLMDAVHKKLSASKLGSTVKLIVKPAAQPEAFARAPMVVEKLLEALRQKKGVCHTFEDDDLSIIVKQFSNVEEPNPAIVGDWDGSYKDLEDHPWEAVMDQSRIPRDRLADLRGGVSRDQLGMETIGRVFIHTNPARRSIEPAILKKVKRKISQSRSGSTCKPRMIFVQTLGLLEELDWSQLWAGITEYFEKHSLLAGVCLMNRRYTSNVNRFGYGLYLLSNAKGGYPFPRDLFESLKKMEREYGVY